MTESTPSSTRRLAVVATVLGVVAVVGVIALGFLLPLLTGSDNLVDLFNGIKTH